MFALAVSRHDKVIEPRKRDPILPFLRIVLFVGNQ